MKRLYFSPGGGEKFVWPARLSPMVLEKGSFHTYTCEFKNLGAWICGWEKTSLIPMSTCGGTCFEFFPGANIRIYPPPPPSPPPESDPLGGFTQSTEVASSRRPWLYRYMCYMCWLPPPSLQVYSPASNQPWRLSLAPPSPQTPATSTLPLSTPRGPPVTPACPPRSLQHRQAQHDWLSRAATATAAGSSQTGRSQA